MPAKPLTLVVDATVTPLETATKEAKRYITDLSLTAGEMVDKINSSLAKIGKGGGQGDGLKQMAKAQNDYLKSVEASARIQQAGFAKGTAQGALQASAALEKMAEQQRAIAQTASAAEGATARETQRLREVAAGAAVAANSFSAQADAMRLNAEVYKKAGVDMGGASDAVVAGHTRMGTSGMILQHVMRSTVDSFAAGLPPMMIFAEQIGRLAEAASYSGQGSHGGGPGAAAAAGAAEGGSAVEGLTGKLKEAGEAAEHGGGKMAAFGAFMAGPWGLAITAGISILGTIIGKMDLFSNKVGEAEKKLRENAEAEDIARQAAAAYDRTLDGLIEGERKLNDELEKEIKNQREVANIRAENAKQRVGDAQVSQESARAVLDKAQKSYDNLVNSPAPVDADVIGAAKNDVDAARAVYDKAATLALDAETTARKALIPVLRDEAKARVDPKLAASNRIEDRQSTLNNQFALGVIGKDAYLAQSSKLEGELAALKDTKSGGTGSQNSLGGMVATIKRLFGENSITSTTGGKHVKGSEHYSGHAIDFVPAGGMGKYSKAEMEQILTDAGVKFSYGTKGVKQFFGPGDKGHSDHFHVGFTGSPTPESADGARESAARRAAAAVEKAAQEEEAVSAAYATAAADRTQARRKGNHSIEQQAQLDRDAVDAKLEEKLVQNTKLKRAHFVLDAYEGITASIRKEQITREEEAAIAVRSLDQQRDLLQLRGALLSIEAQFARTAGERRRIGLEQIENERSLLLKTAARDYRTIHKPNADQTAEYNKRVSGINQLADANAGLVRKQTQGPTADFKDRLKADTDDMKAALDGVKAHGLQSLEDGLVGIISGTESVGSAFKKMAASILADLARIAAEKLILSFIGGFAGGDVPGHATGMIPGFAGGIISGPGTGTSDSILAMHAGKGMIRVSNGESIITAEGTRKHRGLLKAINDNRLPGFASGYLPSYPSIPSASALQVRPIMVAPVSFDLRGAVMTQDLLVQMQRISAAHAQAAIIGGAGLAQQQANEAAMARLG